MALKVLKLRKQIDLKRKELAALMETREALKAKEAELERSIDEVETAEDQEVVDGEIEKFEADREANDESIRGLEKAIADLETELAGEERDQETEPEIPENPASETREVKTNMNTRDKVFGKMSIQDRAAFVARDDVKAFLAEVRSCIREKRALQNVGVTIPEVILGVLRQNIEEYSKLYKHVTVKPLAGDGRAVIISDYQEAIWTDCCGNLNEMELKFNDLEFGCWKVGGYYGICNANLEDSDLDLAAEVLTAIGQGIGRAIDKAILYGGGTRMPLGIVTRLAQTSQPGDYPATARPWVDLHTLNIKSTAATGTALFTAILTNFGAAKGKYSRGEIVHVMNETTYAYLMAQAVNVNAAGAIVSGVGGTMPVIGGIIEVLDFIPDYNIISGYFDLYWLAERAGRKFASSEHVRFLQDQTVFKGTARYDGKPAIAEGFVVNAVNNQSASTSITFGDDDANSVKSIMLSANAATVASGSTLQLVAFTAPGSGTVTWESATTGKATVSSTGLVTGVAAGSSVISATCNGLTANCTVTVTA